MKKGQQPGEQREEIEKKWHGKDQFDRKANGENKS